MVKMVTSSSAEKVQPHSLLRELAPAVSGAGGPLREEVGPCGFGLCGAEERRPQQGRTINGKLEQRGEEPRTGLSVAWSEGCGQWQCDSAQPMLT